MLKMLKIYIYIYVEKKKTIYNIIYNFYSNTQIQTKKRERENKKINDRLSILKIEIGN